METTEQKMQGHVHALDHDDWLAFRRKGIGASEAAGICGEHTYESPRSIWDRKLGNTPEPEETMAMLAGKLSEDDIVALLEKRDPDLKLVSPQELVKCDESKHVIFQDPERPFMVATPDVFYRLPTGGWGIRELKHPGVRQREKWNDGPPKEYVIQLLHQWSVCFACGLDVRELTLTGWFGSDDIIEHVVPIDQDMVDSIVHIERAFWKHVEQKTPPPSDGHSATIESIKRAYPAEEPGKILELDDDEDLVYEWIQAKEARKEAEDRERKLASIIMEGMGDAEIGTIEGQKILTWKQKTYNYKAKPASTSVRRELALARNWRKVLSIPPETD